MERHRKRKQAYRIRTHCASVVGRRVGRSMICLMTFDVMSLLCSDVPVTYAIQPAHSEHILDHVLECEYKDAECVFCICINFQPLDARLLPHHYRIAHPHPHPGTAQFLTPVSFPPAANHSLAHLA